MIPRIKVGAFVRSHYRACWTGVVVAVEERHMSRDKTGSPVITCVLVRDRRGGLYKRKRTMRLDLSWTTPCAPVDISMYAQNWFA